MCRAITYLVLDYNITSAVALVLCHYLTCVEPLPTLCWTVILLVPLLLLCVISLVLSHYLPCVWLHITSAIALVVCHYLTCVESLPTLCWTIMLLVPLLLFGAIISLVLSITYLVFDCNITSSIALILCHYLTCVEPLPTLCWTVILLVPLLLFCTIISLVLSHYLPCVGLQYY